MTDGPGDRDLFLRALREVLATGKATALPDAARDPEAHAVIADLAAIHVFALALAKGNLDERLEVRGAFAGALKGLHANLRHLTWQSERIAEGDFSQKVDFMGDFSKAFNGMVDALDRAREALRRREEELSRANADLSAEVAERTRMAEELLLSKHQVEQALLRRRRLNDMARALTRTLDPEAVAGDLPRLAAEVFDADRCAAAFTSEESGLRMPPPFDAEPSDWATPARLDAERQALLRAISEKKPAVASQAAGFDADAMVVPMVIGDEVLGAIAFANRPPKPPFSEADLLLAELIGQQAASALENARLFRKVQQLAQTDTLTGVASRSHFYAIAERQLLSALRYSRPMALIMFDADHFKRVNDTYGHPAGDRVLAALAEAAKRILRAPDLICRYGGEEFLILLPEVNLTQARIVAERIRQRAAATHVKTEKGDVTVTISLGVASVENGEEVSLDALIERADRALYAAKRAGRNRTVLYSPDLEHRA